MEAPKALDAPGAQITVKVGAAKGRYTDMPASRSYVVDVHVPAKPATVKLGDRALPGFEAAAAGPRGPRQGCGRISTRRRRAGIFDAADRRGVLHVKTKPQPLSSAWTVRIGM